LLFLGVSVVDVELDVVAALLRGVAVTDVELDVVAGAVRFLRVGHLAICRFRAACSW